MSFLGKEYIVERYENLEEFLKAAGLPDEKVKAMVSFNTTQKIEKDGDSYILSMVTPVGKRQIKFKSGVEFDDPRENSGPAKKTIVVDGNTVIQTVKSDKNLITYKSEYNGDEMIATIKNDKWDGVAKAYYKAN